jgi:hypothetical protein
VKTWLNKLRHELNDAFKTPTTKQKEAYGRFCHTLSAAAIVGLVTVVHMDSELTPFIAKRAFALVVCSVILFAIGAALSKGE